MDCTSEVFFTEAAFERYSVQPTFLELLEKYAPKRLELAKGKQPAKIEKGFTEGAGKKHKGPYVTLQSPKPDICYPRHSCLTHDQHRKYLQLQVKHSQHSLQGHHSAQELHDIREFRQYQTQVANERREFQQFAERVAKSSPDEYGFLHLLAQAYIRSVIGQWCDRLKEQPQHYALYQTIGMSVDPVIPSDPVLKHVSCLITLGEALPMTVPEVDPHNPPVLHHMVSVKEGLSKEPEEDSVQAVSTDVNAKKLAAKYHANIVVSFTALEMLLDTHVPPFEQQWEIPITVTSHSLEGNGASPSANTIYIDKPLKQKIIFPHEASAIFHKDVLKQMLYTNSKSTVVVDSGDELVETFLQGGVEFSDSGGGGGGGLDSLDFGGVSEADALVDLETFGSGLMLPLPTQSNQCKDSETADMKSKELKSTDASFGSTNTSKEPEKLQITSESVKQHSLHEDNHISNQSQTGNSGSLSNKTLPSTNQIQGDAESIPESPQSPDDTIKINEQPERPTEERAVHHSTILQNKELIQSSENECGATQHGAQLPSSGQNPHIVKSDSEMAGGTHSSGEHQNQSIESLSPSKEMQANDIRDSPLSPDSNVDTDVNNLFPNSHSQATSQISEQNVMHSKETDVCNKEMQLSPISTTTVTHVSPSSTSKLSESESKPVIEEERELKSHQESDLASPSRHANLSATKESSASEYEGELLIVSVQEDNTATDDMLKELSPGKDPGEKQEDLSLADKDDSLKSSSTTVRTRRSRRLEMSITGEESEDDGDRSVVTRRRSARRRKADVSPSDQTLTPAKKVKKKNKEDNVMDLSGDKVVEEAVQSETQNIQDGKDTDTMECSENEKPLSIADDNTKNINLHNKDTIKEDTKQMQSSNSTPKISGESTQAVATKRTESTSLTNLKSNSVPNKPRMKKLSKSQAQSNAKLGGVSSTIDTIMKLQEALHTRRQQRVPSQSTQANAVNQGETKQNPFPGGEEDPAEYQSPKEGNVSYNLWKLGKMNILIRTRDHGVVNQGDKKFPVTVIPKMEYQAHFGYEQSGLSELCHIWANLYVRPESKVIRGRINAMTSQLLKLEWLDLNSPLWFQCSLNPARSMKTVYVIFDKLQGLPEGKYLLSHNPGDSHACVHLALEPGSKKRVTYDLHTAHDAPALQSSPPAVLPWLPLDPNVPLHRHIEQSTIALTFPPRPPGMKLNPHGQHIKGSNQNASKKKKGKNTRGNTQPSRAIKPNAL